LKYATGAKKRKQLNRIKYCFLKILFVSYYWPPCGGPGVQRALKFARYLPDHDCYPYVITVDDKKASYPIIDKSLYDDVPETVKVFRTDTSEPFGIYSAFTKKKEIPHSGFANERSPGVLQKFSRFIRGNFYIPDARIGWNKYAYAKILELMKSEKFDAVITTSPPHSSQLIGLKLKQETRLPWIADMRDPWTDIYYYKDMMHTGYARRKDAAYEKAVLENADEILVVSPAIKRIFEKKSTSVTPSKIHVIPNGYDDSDFMIKSAPPEDAFVITYTGIIALNYGIQNFIRSVAGIIKENTDKIKLRFIGNTGDDIRNLVSAERIQDHVEYINYMPHKESVGMLMKSTVLLLAIPQIQNNEGIMTGKLFEYLASCKPIICIGPPNGDAAAIINECKAGRTFDYNEQDTVTKYLNNQISLWGKNPDLDRKNELHIKYSRDKLTSELASVIKKRIIS
jgi:glycosyltransferase involved in cell wall biosynthesis